MLSPRHPTTQASHAGADTPLTPPSIGGITVALDLDRAGLTNWTMVERLDDVGGTWYQNRYPGCRCDVPAVAYSHSRFTNAQWTETHPLHTEIQAYWGNICRTQGIMNRTRLETDYVRAEWDDAAHVYHVTLRNLKTGEEYTEDYRVVVGATGVFSEPQRIPVKGEDVFQGRVVHAARWPQELTNDALHGKTVVVIGNGASGVQIMGMLGRDDQIKLVSLAKSKQWLMPSSSGPITQDTNSSPVSEKLRRFRQNYPLLQRIHRWLILAYIDSRFYVQLAQEGAKERKRLEKKIGDWMVSRAPAHLKEHIVPEFPFQAKRYIFEDGYFSAINKPHNRAVFARLESLTPKGVRTDTGEEIAADVVVLATGYNAEHIDMEVNAPRESTNNYKSRADLTWYHGVALPGLPNYFTTLGGNWVVNHSSVTEILEVQASYITQVVRAMRDSGITKLEVKPDAAKKYDDRIAARLQRTTWPQIKSSYWQKGGHGRIFTHYPGTVLNQWWDNAWPVWKDYIGAERLARRQAIRKSLALIVLLVGASAAAYKFGPSLLATGQQLVTRLYDAVADAPNVLAHARESIAGLVNRS